MEEVWGEGVADALGPGIILPWVDGAEEVLEAGGEMVANGSEP